MERDGIIERIDTSAWTSNIVVGRKKSGDIRVCVNLSNVNKFLIPQKHSLEELTEQIAGSTVISKLDLAWGFLQLELAEECRYITAFVSHDSVFQFRSLPFGLATGPSAFQQVIRRILEGLPGCANILDDVLVYGCDSPEHVGRLRGVLNRLVKYAATVRVHKCVLGQPEVDFNGHRPAAAVECCGLFRFVGAAIYQVTPSLFRGSRSFVCVAQARQRVGLVTGMSAGVRRHQVKDCQPAHSGSLRRSS